MNKLSLAARRPEEIPSATADPAPHAVVHMPTAPSKTSRTLGDLTRDELLAEALYDPTAPHGRELGALDDDRLREEVRWRRAAEIREPALAALAKLLSKVSSDSFDSLTQGDISSAQLIEKANSFVSGRNGVKILKLPDRVEDHERRLKNLEAAAE